MRSEISLRLGSFLLFVGICLLVVFVFYMLTGAFQLNILFFSLGSLIIGAKILKKTKTTTSGSRFQTIRRLAGKNDQDTDENTDNN